MKTFNHLLAAAAVTLGVTLTAQAGNALMSPKAKELSNSQRSMVTTTSGSIDLDRSIKPISPRCAEYQHSLRTVSTTGVNIDLANAKRPMLSPKDPRYQTVLRENAVEEFQVAPLK